MIINRRTGEFSVGAEQHGNAPVADFEFPILAVAPTVQRGNAPADAAKVVQDHNIGKLSHVSSATNSLDWKSSLPGFETVDGYRSKCEFQSVVKSPSRFRDGYYGAPTIALRGLEEVRPRSPASDVPFTHHVAAHSDMLVNVLIPSGGKWHAYIPLMYHPTTMGEDVFESTSPRSVLPGAACYQLFNGKYAYSAAVSAPFIRIRMAYGDKAVYAARMDISISEANDLVRRSECMFVKSCLPEIQLFNAGVAVANMDGRYPEFEFYVEMPEWQTDPGLNSFAREFLLQRAAEQTPCYESDGNIDLREYALELARLLRDNGMRDFSEDIDACSDAELRELIEYVNQVVFGEGAGGPSNWGPALHEEPNDDMSVRSAEMPDSECTLIDVGLTQVPFAYRVLGEYPAVYQPGCIGVAHGSAILSQGLSFCRAEQLKGVVKLEFIESKSVLPGFVTSLPTRSQDPEQGAGEYGPLWQERGYFTVHYRGIWPTCVEGVGVNTLQLVAATRNQLICELMYRGAQPGMVSVYDRRLRPTPPSFSGRSHFLDSFCLQNGVVLRRPLAPDGHFCEFGDAHSLGQRGLVQPWLIDLLREPAVRLVLESGQSFVSISTGGSSCTFPLLYELDVHQLKHDRMPLENYQAMVVSRAAFTLRFEAPEHAELFDGLGLTRDPKSFPPNPVANFLLTYGRALCELGASMDDANALAPAEEAHRKSRRGGRRKSYTKKVVATPASLVPVAEAAALLARVRAAQDMDGVAKVLAHARFEEVQRSRAGEQLTPVSWNRIMEVTSMKPSEQDDLEADLRDFLLGLGVDRRLEGLDPVVIHSFVVSGPLTAKVSESRADYRVPPPLLLDGSGPRCRAIMKIIE